MARVCLGVPAALADAHTGSPDYCVFSDADGCAQTMGLSIITACVLAVTLQGMAVTDLLPMLLTGYRCPETALAPLLDGGGILSMISSIAIIGLSATYAGLFERTGLLLGLRHSVMLLRKWLNLRVYLGRVLFYQHDFLCPDTGCYPDGSDLSGPGTG